MSVIQLPHSCNMSANGGKRGHRRNSSLLFLLLLLLRSYPNVCSSFQNSLSVARKQIAFLLHSRKEEKIPANTWLGSWDPERKKEGKLPNEISRYNGRNVSQVGEEESAD